MIKFIQKQIKNNVSKYIPQNELLIYSIKNDLFINGKKILDEIDGGSIFKINNELVLIFDISNGYYYYKKEIIKSEYLIINKINSNEYLATSKPERISTGRYKKNVLIIDFDLKTKKKCLIENFEGQVIGLNSYYFLIINDQYISSINYQDCEKKWSFSLFQIGVFLNKKGIESNYTIEKILGIWKNELIVGFSNSLIVSLDVDTGKEIRRWQALEGYYSDIRGVANQIPASKKFILDKENNKLIALQISSYVEIDLTNGKIVTVSLNEEMEKVGVHHLNDQINYGISPTHLYTNATGTDYKLNESYQNLIAINRNNFEIDWYHRFSPEDEGVNAAPVFDNGYLYQLTGSGTLFIFESVN